MDDIVERYMKHGYIDYYEANGFIRELDEILADEVDTRLERGQDREAFELSCYVFLALGDVEMDDSDGGITIIADECQSVWQTILQRADTSLRREIFDWLLARCGGKIVDYLEDYCEETLLTCFDAPEMLNTDNFYLLRAHETELLERYPDQVLDMYAREMNRLARNTASRSAYQQWVQTLKHMREMPGVEKVVEEIATSWRDQYKRRNAMMQELNAL